MANIDLMVLAGDYVKTAVISEWKVKVGDAVKKGDVLLEVETNKLTQGIESPCDGIVEQILFEEGDDVNISKTVCVVNEQGVTAAPAAETTTAASASSGAKANVDLMVLAGDYVKTAVISEFKVKVGDTVKKGDILLEVETNKLTQGIEAPIDGIVEQILFAEGDDVEISKTVIVLGDGSGAASAATPVAVSEAPEAEAAKADSDKRTVISPLAKKMAKEKGIDLDALAAAFPGKRIGKEDVLAFESGAVAAPVVEETVAPQVAEPVAEPQKSITEIPFKGMRKAVATAMRNSAYTKPHVTMTIDAEMDELLAMKAYLKKAYPDKKITVTGLLALAVRSALKECPYMNGTTTEEAILQNSAINLGIAVDVPAGLLVPIIKNSDAMNGFELFEAVNNVAKGCREGTLPPSDYAGGTFTITNVGAKGVKYFTPIINAPEIAILGVGASRKELILVDGCVKEHTVIGLSLSFDHAAVDGSPAGEFLKVLKEKIEHPCMMAL